MRVNKKNEKESAASLSRGDDDAGTISITPQMIRTAVKELHAKKLYVSSSLIADHLRRYYPIDGNAEALSRELEMKLEDAVCVGLIAKCGADAYCIPTLRQQATTDKTDFTRFSEIYNKRGSRVSTKEEKILERGWID